MKPRSVVGLVATGVLSMAVLAACGSGSATPNPTSSKSSGPLPQTISGTVSYSGSVSPTHQIVIVAVRGGEQAPAYSVVIAKPGPYSLTGVADGAYAISAFMDLGDDMGPPGASEPAGVYDSNGDGTADNAAMQGGAGLTGIDIALKDK